jgi:hypothetical protein
MDGSHTRGKEVLHTSQHTALPDSTGFTQQSLAPRKTGIETIPVAFSDHCAVTIRIATNIPPPTRGKGFWRMNTLLMNERSFSDMLAIEWE